MAVAKSALAGGGVTTDSALAFGRFKSCAACEHFNGDTCSICHCRMRLKVKLQAMKCPIGRW
jgi:hypothetical protein